MTAAAFRPKPGPVALFKDFDLASDVVDHVALFRHEGKPRRVCARGVAVHNRPTTTFADRRANTATAVGLRKRFRFLGVGFPGRV